MNINVKVNTCLPTSAVSFLSGGRDFNLDEFLTNALYFEEDVGPNSQMNMRLLEAYYAQTVVMVRHGEGLPARVWGKVAFYASVLEEDGCYDHFLLLDHLTESDAPKIGLSRQLYQA